MPSSVHFCIKNASSGLPSFLPSLHSARTVSVTRLHFAGRHVTRPVHPSLPLSLLPSHRTLELSSLTSAVTYTIFPILQSPPSPLSLSEFAMALFLLLPRGSPEKPGARFGASGYDEMADESWRS